MKELELFFIFRKKLGGKDFLSTNKVGEDFFSEKNKGAKTFLSTEKGGRRLFKANFSQNPAWVPD